VDSKKRKTNLRIAWIDYQKAHIVPHSWIEKSIELLGVNNKINEMEHKTSGEDKSGTTAIKAYQDKQRNIQGDSLSPLLFCIALIPITNELNRSNCGYKIHGTERKISHLLYMDDLKLIDRSDEELKNEIQILKTLINDIKMKFGLEKCARICLKHGKIYRKQQMGNTMENEIKELRYNEGIQIFGCRRQQQYRA
jgi:hypothetical protein